MSPILKASSIINGEKEEPTGNFSLDFSSGTSFILLRTHDVGIDGLDIYVYAIFLLLFSLLMLIPSLRGIVNTFEVVAFLLDAYKQENLCLMKETDINI